MVVSFHLVICLIYWWLSFGLRQQLLIIAGNDTKTELLKELELLDIAYETGNEQYPNIVSSYPAEEIFINNTWLSEGVYKDIFDGIDYQPTLKINVSDSNQSFTPMLTGNINWVAAKEAAHFWHLFIRFPKTNTIYELKRSSPIIVTVSLTMRKHRAKH